MEALETLTEEQRTKLDDAQDRISIAMLKELEHGEEIELNDTFTLYHYTEDDIFVINLTEEWEEILQVMTENGKIVFEEL